MNWIRRKLLARKIARAFKAHERHRANRVLGPDGIYHCPECEG